MDMAQLTQMVNWLDEEHRRDRAEISRLQQRMESQQAEIVEQVRRIQDLESRLVSTQAQLVRFNQVEQAIENVKQEFVTLIEREEEVRIQAVRELERTRLNDREAMTREISEVRREMEEFQEEAEKKRRKDELRQEHLWKEQEKYNKQIVERFPPILRDLKVNETLIQSVWRLQETYGTRHLVAAQAWIEGLQEALKARDQEMKTLEDDWQKQRRNAEQYNGQNNSRRTSGIVTGEPPANN